MRYCNKSSITSSKCSHQPQLTRPTVRGTRFDLVFVITSVNDTWYARWMNLVFVSGGLNWQLPWPQTIAPYDFTCFDRIRFISWQLRRPFLGQCRWGQVIFGLAVHLSFGSCLITTHVKAALCHISVGCKINTLPTTIDLTTSITVMALLYNILLSLARSYFEARMSGCLDRCEHKYHTSVSLVWFGLVL